MTVRWHGQEVMGRLRRAVMQSIISGAESVREEAVRSILEPPKTGRIYRRRGVEHQASAPGEAPASDLGHLANSIVIEVNQLNLSATVIAGTELKAGKEYAASLEFGTARVRARPYMRPALELKRNLIEIAVAKATLDALG